MQAQTFFALRRALEPALPAVRAVRRTAGAIRSQIALGRRERGGEGSAVCYVTKRFPARPRTRREYAAGGEVKLTYLAEVFPHMFGACNLLYVVSSIYNPATPAIVDAAQRRGIRVVLNQAGVFNRALYGADWEQLNRPLAHMHGRAEYVVYQSEFCRASAEQFLGARGGPSAVLYNPVDTQHYRPLPRPPLEHALVLFTAAATDWRAYRLECAVSTLAYVSQWHPHARLLIPGYSRRAPKDLAMMQRICRWAEERGLSPRQIVFSPRYTREEAPQLFNQAHVLLHTEHNDASPNLVGEALACGLPVAYACSGGTPELVGERAGVGVPTLLDWEQVHQPEPRALAEAVYRVVHDWERFAQEARRRALERFGLAGYIARHRAIFQQLVR